jgi:ribosomal protein L7/L12
MNSGTFFMQTFSHILVDFSGKKGKIHIIKHIKPTYKLGIKEGGGENGF